MKEKTMVEKIKNTELDTVIRESLKEKTNQDNSDNNFIFTRFVNKPVQGLTGVLDHQGHIIPQNDLRKACDMVWTEIASKKKDESIKDYWQCAWDEIRATYKSKSYTDDHEYNLRQLNSSIVWNPANICLAPTDDRRNGVPGETLDKYVLEYIKTKWSSQHALLLNAFDSIQKQEVYGFIHSWTELLENYKKDPKQGYYQFKWKIGSGICFPDDK